MVNYFQKNPFSIASILGKPNTPPKKELIPSTSAHQVKSDDLCFSVNEADKSTNRRNSILDDIMFLQKTLQKSVLGNVKSQGLNEHVKTPHGITPNALTPGKGNELYNSLNDFSC